MTQPHDAMSELAPPRPVEIVTRRRVTGTKLVKRSSAVSIIPDPDESLVTRRLAARKKRRRKRILTAVAVVVGLFPPVWIPYLITWLIWRSRPKQKSMRQVKQSIKKLESGSTGLALKQLQQAHLVNPQNTDALYWLGLLLQSQGRAEEAAEALEIVSQRVPGLPEVESALVDIHIELGDADSAVYHAQRLMDAAPFQVESLVKLASAFEAAGRFDLAVESLKQAPIHKPTLTAELVEVHYHLGNLYERQGQPDLAVAHYKRVLGKDASYRDVAERLAALEEEQDQSVQVSSPGPD